MRAPPSPSVVYFGPFQLDLKARELHQDGRSVRLQEQPVQVLKMLLEHPGEVVTREEMRRTLWPNDTIVDFDQSINAAIKKLRVAFGILRKSRVTWRLCLGAATADGSGAAGVHPTWLFPLR